MKFNLTGTFVPRYAFVTPLAKKARAVPTGRAGLAPPFPLCTLDSYKNNIILDEKIRT